MDFVEVLKIDLASTDDFIIGAKSLSAQPFLQAWKGIVVTGGLFRTIWGMMGKCAAQFI